MLASFWQLNGSEAKLACGKVRATLDVKQSHKGLQSFSVDGEPIQALSAMGIASNSVGANNKSEEPEELYVRGRDLVVTHRQTDSGLVRSQIYWRALYHDEPTEAGVEVVVSMQTNLLDSNPQIASRTLLAAEETLRLIDAERGDFREVEQGDFFDSSDGTSLILFRLPGGEHSYLECLYPADFSKAAIAFSSDSPSGQKAMVLEYWLFDGFLEKGVIRRARMQGWLISREGDTEKAVELYRQLAASELPLTT